MSVTKIENCRGNGKNGNENFTSLFKPVPIKANADDINVGAELTGSLPKTDIQQILEKFRNQQEIKTLSLEYGLDGKSKN